MQDKIFEFYKTLPDETPLTVSDLVNLHDKYSGDFIQIWDDIDRNAKYWMAENWTEDEKIQAYNEDGIRLESLPAVQSKLRHILGAFKQLKTSYKVEAKSDPNDEIKAVLAQLRLRDIESRGNSEYLDAETFEQGLVLKYGVRKIIPSVQGGLDLITIENIDAKDFAWDLSSTRRDMKDVRWMAEIERLTEAEIKLKYPNLTSDYFNRDLRFYTQLNEPLYFYTDEGGKPLYSVFHHYQKVKVKKYYCVFPDVKDLWATDVIVHKFNTKQEAEEKLQYYQRQYRALGLDEEVGEEGMGYVAEAIESAIDYYCFTYRGILAYGRLTVNEFPYGIFFTIRVGKEFISFLDYLKGAQRVFDRMWAEIFYSLKTSIRQVYEGNYNLLDRSETPESVAKKLTTHGGIIWTLSPQGNVINPVPKAPIDSAWGAVAQSMLSYMEDFAGGRTFFGLSQGEESGRAIYNKVAQGQLLASTLFDAFTEFKRCFGRNLLKWLQHLDTEPAVVKTHGALITEQMKELLKRKGLYEETDEKSKAGYAFINIPEVPESYLADADIELSVTEEGFSENERERRWYQLIEAERTDATGTLVMLPSWLELKLETMNIDPDIRQRLIEELVQQRQQAQQMAQQQADIEKAKIMATMRNQDMNALMQVQNQQTNPNQSVQSMEQ